MDSDAGAMTGQAAEEAVGAAPETAGDGFEMSPDEINEALGITPDDPEPEAGDDGGEGDGETLPESTGEGAEGDGKPADPERTAADIFAPKDEGTKGAPEPVPMPGADPVAARLADLARTYGMNPAEFVRHLEVQNLAQAFIKQGADPEIASQRAALEVDKAEVERARKAEEETRTAGAMEAAEREQRLRAEYTKFATAFPDAASNFKATLESVKSYLDRGLTLTEAYIAKENETLSGKIKRLEEKAAAAEKAAKSKAASTGSRGGTGGGNITDPDFAGWD